MVESQYVSPIVKGELDQEKGEWKYFCMIDFQLTLSLENDFAFHKEWRRHELESWTKEQRDEDMLNTKAPFNSRNKLGMKLLMHQGALEKVGGFS